MTALTALAAAALAAVHVWARRLDFLTARPRSRWLSAAGGVVVAYVFVHLLPELGRWQARLEQSVIADALAYLEAHVYLVALAGLIAFYGLEHAARVAPARTRDHGNGRGTGLYTVHLVSFAAYNALIGYLLLHREDESPVSLTLFAVAMVLHFIINDHALRQSLPTPYDRSGRWILAGAVLVGWTIGLVVDVRDEAVAALFGFLAGSIILIALKEELPSEREGQFVPFLLGAAIYSAILLAV